jgi:serine/threonine-protein kinase
MAVTDPLAERYALRGELGTILGPDRFTREIRVAAALNHPHILPLYDSGEAGGRLFYVMPWVRGGSLRERLRGEPIQTRLARRTR